MSQEKSQRKNLLGGLSAAIKMLARRAGAVLHGLAVRAAELANPVRVGLAGAVLAALPLLASPSVAAAESPNFLVILADDVGVEAFESYLSNPINTADGQRIDTPHITQLASEGVRFDNALACPLCTPTRVQMLTGQYNFRNYRAFGYLDNTETTFAQTLRDNGYTTAIAGKWQLSDPSDHPARPDGQGVTPSGVVAPNVTPAVMRDDYGFDSYLLWQLNNTDSTGDKGSRYWEPKLETASADGTASVVVPATSTDYGPNMFTDHLNSFVTQAAANQQPFLAYYSMALPHDPWVSTPDNPGATTGSDTAYFDDNIEYVDKMVGKLVDHLDDPNGDGNTSDSVRNNTVVVFMGDNGTSSAITIHTDERGDVGGDKGVASYNGTHVPFIVSWQGKTAAGTTSDRMVDFTDIYPTLLTTAGIDASGLTLDGKTILDANGNVQNNRSIAYNWYDPDWGPWDVTTPVEFAQDKQFKLYSDGRFYDLQADPDETTNLGTTGLSPAQQASYDALQSTLAYYHDEQFPPVPPLAPDDASIASHLQIRLHNARTDFHAGTAGFDAQWTDRSGQGHNLQSYAGRQWTAQDQGTTLPANADPTLSYVTIPLANGGAIRHSVVAFSAAANELMRADLLGDDASGEQSFDEMTIVLVYAANTDVGTPSAVRPAGVGSIRDEDNAPDASSDNFNLANDGTIRKDNGYVPGSGAVSIPDEELFIRVVRMSPTGGIDQWYYRDGRPVEQSILDAAAFTTRDDDFFLGDLRLDDDFQAGDDFQIAEALLYDTALSDADIAGLGEWLLQWYYPTSGDVGRNGVVDLSDLSVLAGNYGIADGSAMWEDGDLTADGNINVADLSVLAGNWGLGGAAIPEPTTLVLLALSPLALLRRRRTP